VLKIKIWNKTFMLQTALNDALNYLKSGKGNVAIFDATNTTRERRHLVYERIVKENHLKCMFLGRGTFGAEMNIRSI